MRQLSNVPFRGYEVADFIAISEFTMIFAKVK